MYESPIKLIYKNVEQTFENGIIKAIQKVDIDVNKEELLHALKYDKYQYEKGFNDGVNAEIERQKKFGCVEVVHGEWSLTIDDWFGDCYKCSACGEEFVLDEGTPKDNGYNFCPNCGADMRGGDARCS